MIEKLNQEQLDRIPVIRDKWLKIGLSTEPANHELAEEAVAKVYTLAGLTPPKIVIWLSSPFAGCIGSYMLDQMRNQVWDHVSNQVRNQVWNQVSNQVSDQVLNQVWNQVWDQVRNPVSNQVWDQVVNRVWNHVRDQMRNQVWDQVRDQVRNHVWDQVRDQVWDQVENQVENQVGSHVWDQVRNQVWNHVLNHVRNQVENQVWDQVENQVENQVGSQVWDQVRNQVWDHVRNQVENHVENQVGNQVSCCCFGTHEAGWLSFYDYFSEYLDLSRIEGLLDLSQNCGWWWPFENAVILTEKPCFLSRDDQNRLHNESKKAIEYPDGVGVYAWHGVRVPENLILHPETITYNDITAEKNQEIKRCMIEIYTWDKYLTESGAKEIQKDEVGILIEMKGLEDDEENVAKFVRVKDSSTERYYSLRVPPETNTAKEGVAWTFGLKENEYNPEMEA